ncbi:MAG: hypothetical protein ACJAQ3_004384 [Planctomycetota bacterium]|jgi:hypothetical protein
MVKQLARGRFGPVRGMSVLLGLSVLAVGCRTSTVATQNLDALLSSSDAFRYRAATTSVWQDLFRSSIGALRSIGGGEAYTPEVRDVRNPSWVALNNLLDLAASDEGNDAWRYNEKVRIFTRYATSAPSQLCRERAVLELVPHALRLDITEPYAPLKTAANQAELRQALEGLIDATRRIIVERSGVSETASADFDAAITVLEATRLNVQGGSRLLSAIGTFLKGSALRAGLPAEQRTRLEELSLKVQKDLVREALFAGLVDQTDVVRSAGMRSNIAVYGDDFAIEALLKLVPPRNVATPVAKAFARFNVPPVPVEFDMTFISICEAFELRGLPLAAKTPDSIGVETRGTIFATFWQIAINDLMFSDQSRNAAMRALGSLSGAQLETLRSEEWDTWFRGVAPALEEELKALRLLEQSETAPDA